LTKRYEEEPQKNTIRIFHTTEIGFLDKNDKHNKMAI
jgi:hypothetical protein